MRSLDIIRRAGRNLRQAKGRTLLTSLAIAVGAFTITLALAAGIGGKLYAASIVSSNTDVREVYVSPKSSSSFDPSKPRPYEPGPSIDFGGGISVKMLSQEDVNKIIALDHVDSVTPAYNASALYVAGPNQKKYQAGLEPYNSAISVDLVAGDPAKLSDDGVILPDSYLSVLGYHSGKEAIGQNVDIVVASVMSGKERTYNQKIVAVTKSSLLAAHQNTSLSLTGPTVSAMYQFINQGTPLADAYMGATVQVDNENNVDTVKQEIDKAGFSAQTAQDLMGFMFQFINVLMGILIGFGALATVAAVFGIINTQYISVLERTSQIGLMKALGMRNREVGNMFIFEAAWIGFLGGAIGSGLALIGGIIANPYIDKALSLTNGDLLVFQPWVFVVVIGGLMIISMLSCILPSRKAAKLDPIEALRTE